MPRTNVVGTTASPGNGAQRCAEAGERKHRADSTTGPATTTSNDPRRLAALCADLVGSDICTAPGIIVRSYAPVLTLCRRLIEAGIDPDRPSTAPIARPPPPQLRRMTPDDWLRFAPTWSAPISAPLQASSSAAMRPC